MRLLLLDKVININENSISAEKYLSLNEEIYEHHFIKNPVMPAAFMVESSIQLGRIFFWDLSKFKLSLLPIEIKNFKFHKIMIPGSILKLNLNFENIKCKYNINDIIKINIVGENSGEVIFTGTINFIVLELNKLHHEENAKNYFDFLMRNMNN